jgi:predicted 3-demethylubiquinone-9 3-methyltransferase (glyoxalase superfamily)
MQKITPFLWFDGQAGAAIDFYTSIFPDARVTQVSRYGAGGPGPQGEIMSATFSLAGQQFMALNGGPMFQFSPAISFFVHCETQDEVDRYWARLGEGGTYERCGWLKDRFGLSWQIIPSVLGSLLQDPDPARAGRAMQAMLGMVKLDIAALQKAADSA